MSELLHNTFEQMVADEKYEEARLYCHQAISLGENTRFWKIQLGYVYFLDEKNVETYFYGSINIFEELVKEEPSDTNARYWLGYFYNITIADDARAKKELNQVLLLNTNHPYANLSLAGIGDRPFEFEINLLYRVLEQQPMNFRAIFQLANILLQNDKEDEGYNLISRVLTGEPYIEQGYGIMNTYINDVLTGATQANTLKVEAMAKLQNRLKR